MTDAVGQSVSSATCRQGGLSLLNTCETAVLQRDGGHPPENSGFQPPGPLPLWLLTLPVPRELQPHFLGTAPFCRKKTEADD